VRLPLNLLIVAGAILLAVVVWYASGGRAFVFFLPLLFGLPFLARRGRGDRADRP
jgi:hypothetical protein